MSANEKQVGGDHYKGVEYQSWDFAIDARMGFMEMNIIKYIERAPRKHGMADVEKAEHYLEKMLESLPKNPREYGCRPIHGSYYDVGRCVARYFEARSGMLNDDEREVIQGVAMWSIASDLQRALAAVHRIKAKYAARDELRAKAQVTAAPHPRVDPLAQWVFPERGPAAAAKPEDPR